MTLIISGLDVGMYIQASGLSENYEKVYDTSNQFTTANGQEIRRCRGVGKKYSVTLSHVPLNVKNMLRSRSRYGYISCTVDSDTDYFMMDNFGAQVVIQNQELNLWTVSFSLTSKALITGDFGEDTGIYSVTCEGMTYSMKDNQIVGDIKLTQNIGGLPKSGICASQLTFSIDLTPYGGYVPYISPSAECTIGNFIAPKFYVTGRSLDDGGKALTITATDRTIFLDLPFDYTSVSFWQDKDKNVPTVVAIQEIASQAGFKAVMSNNISDILPKMPYADLAASCRSILTSIAEIACGTWYCSEDNWLCFLEYGGESSSWCYFTEDERTDVITGLTSGPIAGVIMLNDNTDSGDTERYTSGYVEDSLRAIKISSKYATASACGRLYERVKDTEYTAFTISRCFCWYYIRVGALVYPDGDYEGAKPYLATNINIFLSPTGPYASISGDAPSDMEWDFSGSLTQQVNKRIAENTKYHGVSISKKEGLVCEGVGSKITMADGKISFWIKNGDSDDDEDTDKESEPAGYIRINGSLNST